MGCLLAWHSSARKGTASRAPETSAPGHLSSGGGTPSKYYVGAFNGGKKVHFSAISLRVPQSLCGRHRQGRRLEGAEQFCGPGRTTPLVPPPALFNLDLRRFRQARWLDPRLPCSDVGLSRGARQGWENASSYFTLDMFIAGNFHIYGQDRSSCFLVEY